MATFKAQLCRKSLLSTGLPELTGCLAVCSDSEFILNPVFSDDTALSEDSGPDVTGDLPTGQLKTSGHAPHQHLPQAD